MALFQITGPAPAVDAKVPSATARLGRHANMLHWWTTIEQAITGAPQTIAARLGGAPAAQRAEAVAFDTLYGRRYPRFVNIAQSRSQYFRAALANPPAVFSIISLQQLTLNGSKPWGIAFSAPDAPAAGPTIYPILLTQGNGANSSFRFSDGTNTNTVLFEGLGRPSPNIRHKLTTVIDTTNWQVKAGIDSNPMVSVNAAPFMGASAPAAQNTFRIGSGDAANGMAGYLFEAMIVAGDITQQPTLQTEISEYFAAHYQG